MPNLILQPCSATVKLLPGAVKELQGGSYSWLDFVVIEPGPQFNSKAFDVLTCEHDSSLI